MDFLDGKLWFFKKAVPFRDYLKAQAKFDRWHWTIEEQTNWDSSAKDVNIGRDVRHIAYEAYLEELEKGTEDLRSRTLQHFAHALQSYRGRKAHSTDIIERALENPPSHLSEVDSLKLPLIKDFLTNPAEFTKEKIREVFDSIVRNPLEEKLMMSPYHILVVLSQSAVTSITSMGRSDWRFLKKREEGAAPDQILGAVALLPHKTLYQDMLNIHPQNPLVSHPIFDFKGNVRFPK